MITGMRSPLRALPALMLLLASSPLLAANPPFLVQGVVVDMQTHAPVPFAHVSLAPTSARDQKSELSTARDGSFSFSVNTPGKYELKAFKPGYPQQDYKQTTYSGLESAIAVRDDQDTRHIVFELRRGGVISGQIRDEDSEPVGNALVTLFRSIVSAGERTVPQSRTLRANANGEFRFGSLLPGRYYVCAMGRPWFADSLIVQQGLADPTNRRLRPQVLPADAVPDLPPSFPDPSFRGTAFITTFYPGVQTIEAASPIALEPAQETRIAITLPLARAVSIHGSVAIPAQGGREQVFLNKKVLNHNVQYLDTWTNDDGSFELTNVAPGSYELVARPQITAGHSPWYATQRIEVGASDVNVQLNARASGSISGQIFFDGDPPKPDAPIRVALRKDASLGASQLMTPEGKFEFRMLQPERYEVISNSAEYIAAYLRGPAGEHLPLYVDIQPGAAAQADLVLTHAVAVIEGTAEQTGSPCVGAFVLALPKNPTKRWAFRVDQTDSDGSFRLASLPAGDYSLIALSTGEDVAYWDPKVFTILSAVGKPIHVEAGDHLNPKLEVTDTQALHLPLP